MLISKRACPSSNGDDTTIFNSTLCCVLTKNHLISVSIQGYRIIAYILSLSEPIRLHVSITYNLLILSVGKCQGRKCSKTVAWPSRNRRKFNRPGRVSCTKFGKTTAAVMSALVDFNSSITSFRG